MQKITPVSCPLRLKEEVEALWARLPNRGMALMELGEYRLK